MKKINSSILMVVFVLALIPAAYAVWYNPFTWFVDEPTVFYAEYEEGAGAMGAMTVPPFTPEIDKPSLELLEDQHKIAYVSLISADDEYMATKQALYTLKEEYQDLKAEYDETGDEAVRERLLDVKEDYLAIYKEFKAERANVEKLRVRYRAIMKNYVNELVMNYQGKCDVSGDQLYGRLKFAFKSKEKADLYYQQICKESPVVEGLPDLVVDYIEISTERPAVGDGFGIRGYVKNRGTVASPPAKVKLLGTYEAEDEVLAIEPGSQQYFYFTVYEVLAPGLENLVVVVDPDDEIEESDELNNRHSRLVKYGEERQQVGILDIYSTADKYKPDYGCINVKLIERSDADVDYADVKVILKVTKEDETVRRDKMKYAGEDTFTLCFESEEESLDVKATAIYDEGIESYERELQIFGSPDKHCICGAHYLPVCGDDGKTYSNDCQRMCAGVGLSHHDAC